MVFLAKLKLIKENILFGFVCLRSRVVLGQNEEINVGPDEDVVNNFLFPDYE